MSKAIFFIRTPFEMICSINAIGDYKLKDYTYYIIKDPNERFHQLIGIADFFKINYKIIPIHQLINESFKKNVVKALIRNNQCYDYVFTGDYRFVILDIVALRFLKNGGNLIKLDDGNNTIALLRKDQESLRPFRFELRVLNILCLLRSIYIQYYTVYADIPAPHLNIKQNNLSKLGILINEWVDTEYTYFLGTNPDAYCKDLNITKEQYELLLNKSFEYIRERYENVIYIPHGFDTSEVTGRMCDLYGFKVLKLKECAESYLIKNRTIPRAVYGFTSNALFSIKKIYPQTEVFNILPNFHSASMNAYIAISEYYNQNGIQLINCNII